MHTVSWLKDEDPFFVTAIVKAFRPEVFVPGEACTMPPALHVIHSGSAVYGGNILSKGHVWGDDVIVYAAHLRSRTHARALTYVEAFFLTRDTIFHIALGFEETHRRLRRAARLLALRRYVVLVGKVSHYKTWQASKKQAPPMKRLWKRAYTKSHIATDVQRDIGDASFARKPDEDLSFQERFQ